MNAEFIFRTSERYIAKCVLKGLIYWAIFNIVTGLLTGDHSLNDNYFILTVILGYIALISSYKVNYERGHISTYQVGMLTNNINLFEAVNIQEEKDRITIFFPDDVRHTIKHIRLSEQDQVKLLELAIPLEGSRPQNPPEIIRHHQEQKLRKKRTGYTKQIFMGVCGLAISINALFTDTLLLPGRNGSIRFEDEPTYFMYWVVALLLISPISILTGIFGKKQLQRAGKPK